MPNVKRKCRSPPNFKRQRRIPRQSPQYRGFPAEDFSGYASVSRNHSSPPHASKWFNSERIFQDHLWKHEPKRPRERSPPARIFSPRNVLEDADSRLRMKPDEHYEANYAERFQEYFGYGGGSKHDVSRDGQRGKNNRYEVPHPGGHLESIGNISQSSLRW